MAIIIDGRRPAAKQQASGIGQPRFGRGASSGRELIADWTQSVAALERREKPEKRYQTLAELFGLWFGFAPAILLAIDLLTDHAGSDPVAAIIADTGTWSLRMLWISLAITPIRGLTGWQWLGPLRRNFGLLSFLYAILHMAAYAVFEWELNFAEILNAAWSGPYLLTGWFSFILFIPLAMTSRSAAIKRIGGKNWRWLHKLVYLCAILGALHFLLLTKRDVDEPGVYILLLCALFYFRIPGVTKMLRENARQRWLAVMQRKPRH